jgi:hypothetical protein
VEKALSGEGHGDSRSARGSGSMHASEAGSQSNDDGSSNKGSGRAATSVLKL